MARIRKRVQAVRRAADGSAFDKCEECGVMIAIALFDMHECGEKRREPKRFKCVSSDSKPIGSFGDEPRSPFVFFVEDFRRSYDGNMVDASRICFRVWKNMSREDQKPLVARAEEVNDEADSKAAAKCDKFCECCDHEEEDFDSSDHFEHEFW
ncbi:BnaC02g02360D [Brassica napus]|uniref:BnaC02g02360D protein n=1 Tax=Brassica napus TaxID=3708 RepID=A0A078FMN4_BRANA|nr:BnaC02g02360D [Brassica napus]